MMKQYCKYCEKLELSVIEKKSGNLITWLNRDVQGEKKQQRLSCKELCCSITRQIIKRPLTLINEYGVRSMGKLVVVRVMNRPEAFGWQFMIISVS